MAGMGDKQVGAAVSGSGWLTLSEKTVLPLLTVIGALNLALLIDHSDVNPLVGAMPILFLGIVSIGGLANLHWVRQDLPPLRTVRIIVVGLSLAGLVFSLFSLLQFEGAVALSSLVWLSVGFTFYFLEPRRLAILILASLTVYGISFLVGFDEPAFVHLLFGLFSAAGFRVFVEMKRLHLTREEPPTSNQETELSSETQRERFSLAVRGTNDGFWDWDLLTDRVEYSPRWHEMAGSQEEANNTSPDLWYSRVHPDDLEGLRRRVSDHLEGKSSHLEAEYRLRQLDASFLWMLARGLAVFAPNGKATRIAGSQTDITERKVSEKRLLFQAFHDQLTGLPNRAHFSHRLVKSIRRTRRDPGYRYAVLFLDLDRFKTVNDSLGHLVGDRLLRTVAGRLQKVVDSRNTVARLGGDEFAILIDEVTSPIEAVRIANRLLRIFRTPFRLEDKEFFITASTGVAWGRKAYELPEELLRDADTAMYQAKQKGGNCCEVFVQTMHRRALDRLELESDLHRAVEHKEFCLFYQPIFSLHTMQIVAFEALIRWNHPEQGLLVPRHFLQAAEETGLIVPIGWWTLKEACRQMKYWQQNYLEASEMGINVNVSGRQLMQSEFVRQVMLAVKGSELEARFLHLEITEHVLMSEAEPAAALIGELQDHGIELHLDDFGTGYSSLSYLDRLNFDALKLDRSFLSGLDANGENWKIVRAMVDLAHNLGMDVIVEGLEAVEQIEQVRLLNCTLGQGYYFSPPVDATTVEQLLLRDSDLASTMRRLRAKTG